MFRACAACEQPQGASGIEFGSDPGQVEVTEADDATYTIVAHSESGPNFTLSKNADEMETTCEPAGEAAAEPTAPGSC